MSQVPSNSNASKLAQPVPLQSSTKQQNKPDPTAQKPYTDTQPHDDRRRHSRVNYKLKARYLAEDGRERPCVVVNISAGGAMVRAKTTPRAGEKVVLYIDSVGRFEGEVIRSGKHAFAVKYKARRAKIQRTADALIRVLNRGQQAADRRKAPRIEVESQVIVTNADGSQLDCTIMDVSLTGASLNINPQPALGTEMIIGRMKARVVRLHEDGVGVVFIGSAKRMEDIIKQTTGHSETPPAPPPQKLISSSLEAEIADVGTEIASHFGRKDT